MARCRCSAVSQARGRSKTSGCASSLQAGASSGALSERPREPTAVDLPCCVVVGRKLVATECLARLGLHNPIAQPSDVAGSSPGGAACALQPAVGDKEQPSSEEGQTTACVCTGLHQLQCDARINSSDPSLVGNGSRLRLRGLHCAVIDLLDDLQHLVAILLKLFIIAVHQEPAEVL